MTPEMNWSNIEIDQVKPIRSLDVTKDDELRESFDWKSTQPLLKQGHQHKGINYKILDYQIQFIKAYQLFKLNEKGHNQDFH